MPDSQRSFVLLLKFNSDDVKDIALNIDVDLGHWKSLGGSGDCTFLPVAGEYDMVVKADDGTAEQALALAMYLRGVGRYTATILTVFSDEEFGNATNAAPPWDSHRK